MVAQRPDDVPDLRPPPSPWRYLGYLVAGWVAFLLACRLLFALLSYEAPYAWAAIIVLGIAATLVARRDWE